MVLHRKEKNMGFWKTAKDVRTAAVAIGIITVFAPPALAYDMARIAIKRATGSSEEEALSSTDSTVEKVCNGAIWVGENASGAAINLLIKGLGLPLPDILDNLPDKPTL